MLAVVAAVLFLVAYVASATTATYTTTNLHTPISYAVDQAQPYLNQALQAVREAPLADIFHNLSQFIAALVSGQQGALTPEIIVGAQAALSWIVLGAFVLAVVAMVAAVVTKVAKVGLLVASVIGLLVYVAANHAYLLAPLGL